jgi:hypothetical protein
MFTQLASIAKNTFLEAVRQPIYFIIVMIAAAAVALTTATTAYSMDFSSSAEVSSDDKLLLDVSLATIFVCGVLLAAFLATAVISREIDRKTVLTVVSKPVARPTLVVGKYLGVAGAILIAQLIMTVFVLMAVRHEVLSTTADELDGPVLAFGLGALALAMLAGTWCNFFYNWSFTQTTVLLMLPLMLAAYLGVLLVSKTWELQPIGKDFKPQVTIACVCVLMAVLVLTAVATAASARLGQVMTLVICAGVFGLGMTSNYFFGRRAIQNDFVARVQEAAPRALGQVALTTPGDTYDLRLEMEPRVPLRPGTSIYYGPNPSGHGLRVRAFERFEGDATLDADVTNRQKPAALVVRSSERRVLTIVRVGAEGVLVSRPPAPGDFVFTRPTEYSPLALGAWSLIPNVQSFWLIDAVTQNQKIPPEHVVLVALYALMQIGALLSLAVILFQTREVG